MSTRGLDEPCEAMHLCMGSNLLLFFAMRNMSTRGLDEPCEAMRLCMGSNLSCIFCGEICACDKNMSTRGFEPPTFTLGG